MFSYLFVLLLENKYLALFFTIDGNSKTFRYNTKTGTKIKPVFSVEFNVSHFHTTNEGTTHNQHKPVHNSYFRHLVT